MGTSIIMSPSSLFTQILLVENPGISKRYKQFQLWFVEYLDAIENPEKPTKTCIHTILAMTCRVAWHNRKNIQFCKSVSFVKSELIWLSDQRP